MGYPGSPAPRPISCPQRQLPTTASQCLPSRLQALTGVLLRPSTQSSPSPTGLDGCPSSCCWHSACIGLALLSWTDPSQIKVRRSRPGLDFTGGTQIQLERRCGDRCEPLQNARCARSRASAEQVAGSEPLTPSRCPSLDSTPEVRLLDGGQSLAAAHPRACQQAQGQAVIDADRPLWRALSRGSGPVPSTPSVPAWAASCCCAAAWCPSAGGLCRHRSLHRAFATTAAIAVLALLALAHDLVIVCGDLCLAWPHQSAWRSTVCSRSRSLTIAGYSVNDTVVVFDRIRERSARGCRSAAHAIKSTGPSPRPSPAPSTPSGTTLLPLIGLDLSLEGPPCIWFAIALALGVDGGQLVQRAQLPPC